MMLTESMGTLACSKADTMSLGRRAVSAATAGCASHSIKNALAKILKAVADDGSMSEV
jgi:hypothetical protein